MTAPLGVGGGPMTRRAPRCYYCQTKPVRRGLSYFCSRDCAADWALGSGMAHIEHYWWCWRCAAWTEGSGEEVHMAVKHTSPRTLAALRRYDPELYELAGGGAL